MSNPVHPATSIGHVHLKVADLNRAIEFYHGVLGFNVRLRYGEGAAFLAAGDYHHHIGLNTWESQGGTPAPKGHTGLYHTAFLYPDRANMIDAVRRVAEAGYPVEGAADHGVSVAVYFSDPDGNGVELYYDKPEADWPRDENGNLTMRNDRFDVHAMLAEAQ